MVRHFLMVGCALVLFFLSGDRQFVRAQKPQQASVIDLQLAESYFEELNTITSQDDRKLWGVSLMGPALFVEPNSRSIVTNRPVDMDGIQLVQHGKVYVGTLPDGLLIANTSIRWVDEDWTMIMWPLPTEFVDRKVLMAHESWHRIQGEIPVASCNEANLHLDTMEARVFLQMEWFALAKALESEGGRHRAAIRDAIVFRTLRRERIPDAAIQENRMELHEGMAEYTGIRLGTDQDSKKYAIQAIRTKPEQWSTLVRSFAYLSGPAYGLLLDEHVPGWRQRLEADSDLGELLRLALKIDLPNSLPNHARECIAIYGAEPLVEAERAREDRRIEQQRRLQSLFVEGPTLTLPLASIQMSFDPRQNVPLDGVGTVYGNLVVTDSWGKLSSTGEAMISNDFKQLIVPVKADFEDSMLYGPDWSLDIAQGWHVGPAKIQGKWTVRK